MRDTFNPTIDFFNDGQSWPDLHDTLLSLYSWALHKTHSIFHCPAFCPPPLPSTIFRNLSLFCQLLGQAYQPLNTLLISSGLRKWRARKAGPYFGCPPNGPKPFKIYMPCNPNVSRGPRLHAVEKRPKPKSIDGPSCVKLHRKLDQVGYLEVLNYSVGSL